MTQPHWLNKLQQNPTRIQQALLHLALFVCHAGFMYLGFLLAQTNQQVAPLWPAAGSALCAFLLFGYRVWFTLFLSSLLSHLLFNNAVPHSFLSAFGLSMGDIANTALTTYLIRRVSFSANPFQLTGDTFLFLLAILLSSLLTTTTAVLVIGSFNLAPWLQIAKLWRFWWLGITTGALLIAPLLLAWLAPPLLRRKSRSFPEAVALFLFTVIAGNLIFRGGVFLPAEDAPLTFLSLPLLIWSSFRFGARGATTILAIFASFAVWGTIHQTGPFGTKDLETSYFLLQAYLLICIATNLVLVTVLSERKQAEAERLDLVARLEERVRERTRELELSNAELVERIEEQRRTQEALSESETSLANAQRIAKIGNWDWDLRDDQLYWSQELYHLLGLDPKETKPSYEVFVEMIHPEDAPLFKKAMSDARFRGVTYGVNCRLRRPNGEMRTFYGETEVSLDDQGEAIRLLGTVQDITEKKLSEERIHHLVHYDPLTHLSNRVLFQQRLQEMLLHAQRQESMLGLFFLDLDRFKRINETFGHTAGDSLLKTVAQRLTQHAEHFEIVARLGGDEFALLLHHIPDITSASERAQNLLDTLSSPVVLEGHETYTTASIGISIFPNDGEDAHTLLKNADTAMARAKEKGKNHYRFFTEEMNASVKERLFLESGLRKALEENQLQLFYQPQMELEGDRISGLEALIRWQHPEKGFIPPSKFIPIAEETGQIVELGQWVLRTACQQQRDWASLGFDDLRLSINLSGRQIQTPALLDKLLEVLKHSNADISRIELELTESYLMKNPEVTIRNLHEIKEMGVSLAVDDFGIAYSSLSQLRRFPIDRLKVDRSFVQEIPQNSDDCAIVATIIAMGQNLKLKVVAEGVENIQQLDFLREHGCHEIQGYYLSQPLPASELTPLLSQRNNTRPE